jgi:WD40 repeat protein
MVEETKQSHKYKQEYSLKVKNSRYNDNYNIAVTKDDKIISFGDEDTTLYIWNKSGSDFEGTESLDHDKNSVKLIIVFRDNSFVSSAQEYLFYWVRDSDGKYKMASTWESKSQYGVKALAVLSEEEKVFVSGSLSRLDFWKLNDKGTFECISEVVTKLEPNFFYKMSNNNLIVCSYCYMTIFKRENENCKYSLSSEINGTGNFQQVIEFSDGRLLSIDGSKIIGLWEERNGKYEGREISGHEDEVQCLVLLDKDHFASGGRDYTIRIWTKDAKGEFVTVTKIDFDNMVFGLTTLSDQSLVATFGDNVIRIFKCLE